MKPYRNAKLASLIREELSRLLLREIEFENALVTIISVTLSDDLLQARVTLGIIPYEKGPKVLAMIEKQRRDLQYKLLKRMKIKLVPRLIFEVEENI